jgi:hypothetical protein
MGMARKEGLRRIGCFGMLTGQQAPFERGRLTR